MNKALYILLGFLISMPTFAATPEQHRSTTSARAMVGATKTDARKSSLKWDQAKFDNNTVSVSTDTPEPNNDQNAERTACLSNNVGFSTTFVWASRDSDTNNYASMVEDTEHPENNICFARVEIYSYDKDINVSDFQGRYFPTDSIITCGNWIDQNKLEKRILDSKKTARTWATVAGSVGGAGIGVGAMELFGNKLLSTAGVKSVEGQNALKGDALLISQLKVMKKNNQSKYDTVMSHLNAIKEACDNNETKIKACDQVNYNYILSELNK